MLKDNETSAMLVYQVSSVDVPLSSYVKAFIRYNKFA